MVKRVYQETFFSLWTDFGQAKPSNAVPGQHRGILRHSHDKANEARLVTPSFARDMRGLASMVCMIGTAVLVGTFLVSSWNGMNRPYLEFSSKLAHTCKIVAIASASTIGPAGLYLLTTRCYFSNKAEGPAEHSTHTKL